MQTTKPQELRQLQSKAEGLYKQGREALIEGRRLEALACFEKANQVDPGHTECLSYLGLLIAYERGKVSYALELCENAVRKDPKSVECHLNLGKVYLRAGLKIKAIEAFRKGLKIDNTNPEIIAELQAIGTRKKPVIPWLSRGNFLNKYLGIILHRLGFR
jgi:tetratricopeptide (TPR) repeat protein